MKKTIYSSLLFLLIVSLLSSCLKKETEYLPLGEVNLQMTELLSADSRSLHFNFFTVEDFECMNNIIRFSSSSTTENIDIGLIDVEVAELCLERTGPALITIDLGSYDLGSFPVSIKVGDVENSGTLQVTQDFYVIGFDNPQMITAAYDTLHRIPDGIIWGVVGYWVEDDEPKVDAFLDSLENIGAIPRTLTPGEYGYFEADSTGNIIVPENSGYNFTKSFIFDYTGPMSDVEDIIAYYYNVYPTNLFVYLYNSKGEIYVSHE